MMDGWMLPGDGTQFSSVNNRNVSFVCFDVVDFPPLITDQSSLL